jgi:hypothetical protein
MEKLNNTFKRELTKELKKMFPSIEIKHEDNYVSLKWKEFNSDESGGVGLHWIGIRNGGKNQSTVLHTFGIVEKFKTDFHSKVEDEALDFAQKLLDKWVKEGRDVF